MKQIVKLILAIMMVAIFPATQIKAESQEEITLTVSSDGPTKDEALKNALRTAIEQAYGAFVSANTTILNDQLVKDEIVTVSNGSIKEYEEIAAFEKPDGSGYMMTLNATVSLPHLITYTKNLGSECEFAGNNFGMDLKLFNLQKENELKALYNMIPVVEELCKKTMHWEIEIGEPRIPKFYRDYRADIENIRFDGGSHEFDISEWNNEKAEKIFDEIRETPSQFALVPMRLYWRSNTSSNAFTSHIKNILNDIKIDGESHSKYWDMGLECGYLLTDEDEAIWLRNDSKDLSHWCDSLVTTIEKVKHNFVIIDNTGQISDFNPVSLVYYGPRTISQQNGITYNDDFAYGASGIFSPMVLFLFNDIHSSSAWDPRSEPTHPWHEDFYYKSRYLGEFSGLENKRGKGYGRDIDYGWEICVIMPTADLGKYSSFKVVPKPE